MSTQKDIKWRKVEGYEDLYEVSSDGNVKSLKSGKLMIPQLHQGYRRILFYKNKRAKRFKVSRLVAKAFIHNPESKPNVNHKDGRKDNDRYENLEWCSQSENCRHSLSTGLRKSQRTVWGEKHPKAFLTQSQVIEMRKRRLNGETTTSLANYFKTTASTVSRICIGQTWKHIPDFISPITSWTQKKRI